MVFEKRVVESDYMDIREETIEFDFEEFGHIDELGNNEQFDDYDFDFDDNEHYDDYEEDEHYDDYKYISSLYCDYWGKYFSADNDDDDLGPGFNEYLKNKSDAIAPDVIEYLENINDRYYTLHHEIQYYDLYIDFYDK